ncbi:MAG: carbohydrate ABC transporter permease [Oscillospiraceae bacterium]|jgi:putative aldouronate transport system permease protein|nr:carbohydrate ABC transporter permease [Oscillospiraceae bacterium]
MAVQTNKIRQSFDNRLLIAVFYVVIGIFTFLCLFPFVLMITSSFMKESEIVAEGYKIFPREWTLSAYQFLLNKSNKLLNAYKVTIINTLIGTVLGLFFMSMAGFVLNRKDFKYRNAFSFFIYFTTLFSGGLVPTYMNIVNNLHLKDSVWAMILPGLMSAWSIFLMRNFMKSIPDSLYESATLDGAGDFRIYWQIFMPLAIPSLATVGLFLALGFWNEWYNAMLYIETESKIPLQYFLKRMVDQTNVQTLIKQGVQIDAADLPTQSIKMATAVMATGPIILLYPFVQRYFVGGLTIGAVKG